MRTDKVSFKLIAYARKLCNIKQIDLCKRLEIGQSNYANMETGRLIPKHITTKELAAIIAIFPDLENLIINKNKELAELESIKNTFEKFINQF